ncbi:MAG: hypothetical protein ACP5SH_18340 [Syntrophobacteraceae bacterium]
MKDQNSGETKPFPGCMDRMREMMRMMMSEKKGGCCAGMEKMAQMMASCCPDQSREEGAEDGANRKASK